jgi:hypothetical protein
MLLRDLVIAGVLGVGTLMVTQPQEEVKDDVVAEVCPAQNGRACDCDPCLCGDECPCGGCKGEESVLEPTVEPEVQVIREEFDSTQLETQMSSLEQELSLLKAQLNTVAQLEGDVQMVRAKQDELSELISNMPTPFSEDEIRKIVREELEVKLKLMNQEGKEVEKTVKVSANGMDFELNPSEVLTHINGVPVNAQPYTSFQNNERVYMYQTPQYRVTTPVRSNRRVLRSRLVPRLFNRSSASVCGPNGCN